MLKNIIQYVTHDIWFKKEHEYKSKKVRWAVRQFKVILVTVQGIGEHGILVESAALTFYTLMSLVPIAALVFGIANGFGLEARLSDYLYGHFPQYSLVVEQVISFANALLQRTRGGVIALGGIIVLFWSVLKVFSSIESAFNKIWEARPRSLSRKFSDYTTVVVVAPILGIISVSIGLQVQEHLLHYAATPIVDFLLEGVSMVMIWLMFAFIYFVMPNTRVKMHNALMAGIIAGTFFLLFQWGYVYVQSKLTSYNAIYGSFAAVPLFLIWLQTSWQIMLFGAELSFSYQNINRFEYEKLSRQMSYEYHKKAVLAVMHRIVVHFSTDTGAVSSEIIAGELNLPVRVVRDAVLDLEKAGLVVFTLSQADKVHLYLPARDVRSLRVCDVLHGVEAHGTGSLDMQESRDFRRIGKVLDGLYRYMTESQYNVLLTDLKTDLPDKD